MLICAIFNVLFLISCTDDYDEQNPVIGTWVKDGICGNRDFIRYDTLHPQKVGCIFYKNGDFVERANSGWCGTPPISYKNYNGKWKKKDEIIYIKTKYWGGEAQYLWEINRLTNDSLIINVIKEEYK